MIYKIIIFYLIFSKLEFTRGEIVTLFNAFGRLSESIMSSQNFREFYESDTKESNVKNSFS